MRKPISTAVLEEIVNTGNLTSLKILKANRETAKAEGRSLETDYAISDSVLNQILETKDTTPLKIELGRRQLFEATLPRKRAEAQEQRLGEKNPAISRETLKEVIELEAEEQQLADDVEEEQEHRSSFSL